MCALKRASSRTELLISSQGLADGLKAEPENWRVVDCRFNLLQPEAGQNAYDAGHIPGAWYAHLEADLSGPVGPQTGRHPLPEPAGLARLFGRWGIRRDTQVVVYDEGSGGHGARLWWLLRFMGHPSVRLLDGGFALWQAARLPVSQTPAESPVTEFHGAPGHMLLVNHRGGGEGAERVFHQLGGCPGGGAFHGLGGAY